MMNEKDKNLQKIKISKAKQSYENFVNLANDTNDFKESKIGTWLMSHSDLLIKEKHVERGKYISCHEGTLVYCDFGINPGAEIGGWHFAVTLNKRDNSYNPIITVVPLTSKNKNLYLDIGTEVYDRIIFAIDEKIEKFASESEYLTKSMRLLEKYQEMDCGLNTNEEVKNALIIQISRFTMQMCEIDGEAVKHRDDFGSLVETSIKKSKTMLDKVEKSLLELCMIQKKYQKYKQNSYAAVFQITTISKLRFSARMNKFDPIASVQVSDAILKRLKKDCLEKFG